MERERNGGGVHQGAPPHPSSGLSPPSAPSPPTFSPSVTAELKVTILTLKESRGVYKGGTEMKLKHRHLCRLEK